MPDIEHTYELRNRDGVVVCTSPLPQLGYSDDRLKQILDDGYRYYIDGKPQRRGTREKQIDDFEEWEQ